MKSKAQEIIEEMDQLEAVNPFTKKLNPDSPLKDIRQALVSELTTWDEKLQAKQPNIHRLAIGLKAVDAFEKEAKKSGDILGALKSAFTTVGINQTGRFSISPINKIVKKLGLV